MTDIPNLQASLNDLLDIIMRLSRYGHARDRAADREPRTITITDDEALLLLTALGAYNHPLLDMAIERLRGKSPGG